jgi:Ca-activated chloride channel family protein
VHERAAEEATRMRPTYKALALAASLPLLMGVDLLQSRNHAVEDGNERMVAGKAEEALGQYDKALAKLPAEPGVHFNRGAALYSLSRFDEAAQAFLRATESKNPSLKASAFYNLGNAFFQTKKYSEAVEAFKKSLTYDPSDQRAKWNLELALKSKREEDKKNQDKNKDDKNKKDDKDKGDKKDDKQDQDDKNKKDDKDKGDKKDDKQGQDDKPEEKKEDRKEDKKEDKPEEKKEDKKDEQQAKQDEQKNDKKDGTKPEPKPSAGDKKNETPADLREIDGILDSLERSPKALEQERARLRAVRRQPPVKDW